jgi:hypothetical protein
MTTPQIVNTIHKFTKDNSPLILTVIGVTGTVSTALLVGKASYRSALVIDQLKNEAEAFGTPEPDAKAKVQAVWPLFIPAVGTGAMTVTCVILANRIGTKRAAAMAAAYTVVEKSFEEYREKVIEKLGPNKEQAARDEIAQERVDKNPVGNREIIVTGNGEVPFFDVYTGRYFYSTYEDVKKAENDLNYKIIHHNYASLNDFYDKIGLSHTPLGEEVGWNSNKLMDMFISTTVTDDQRPCFSIEFTTVPVRNYDRTY